jgi:hypothetical protein
MTMANVPDAKAEARRRLDKEIDRMRQLILTLCQEEDVSPDIAAMAALAVAAQIAKTPMPGGRMIGTMQFEKMARRVYKGLKVTVTKQETH